MSPIAPEAPSRRSGRRSANSGGCRSVALRSAASQTASRTARRRGHWQCALPDVTLRDLLQGTVGGALGGTLRRCGPLSASAGVSASGDVARRQSVDWLSAAPWRWRPDQLRVGQARSPGDGCSVCGPGGTLRLVVSGEAVMSAAVRRGVLSHPRVRRPWHVLRRCRSLARDSAWAASSAGPRTSGRGPARRPGGHIVGCPR